VDVAHAEVVEKELNNFIERRSRKGNVDPDEREELWKESVGHYNARRREENRLAWWRILLRPRRRPENAGRGARQAGAGLVGGPGGGG
jgi:hypothetical protein